MLEVHVEEPVARVSCHVVVHHEELLVVVRREMAHRLFELRDAADEFFDRGHAFTAVGCAAGAFAFTALLRAIFFCGVGVGTASSLASGVISSGACSSSSGAVVVVAGFGFVSRVFRGLVAICSFPGFISWSM